MPAHTPARTLRDLNVVCALGAGSRGDVHAHNMPITVHLQIASGCNLECYMCIELLRPPAARRGRDLKTLSREVFDRLCTEVFPYSSRLHLGFGGEPTLAPDFLYFLQRGFDCGQRIDLTTNGTRLGQADLATVIAQSVATLRVSVDAATPETYERIRVGSSWKHFRAGLDKLNTARLAQAQEERGELVLVFVLMKSNLHEFPDFVELAAELGATGVRGQHVIPTTEQGRAETLSDQPERYNEVRGEAARRALKLGLELDAPRPFVLTDQNSTAPQAPAPVDSPPAAQASCRRDCRLPTQDIFVTYEGKVTPCCNPHASAKMQVGDLSEQHFADIWNSAPYLALRSSLMLGDLHPICSGCSIGLDRPPPVQEDPEWLLHTPTLRDWATLRGPVSAEKQQEGLPMLNAMGDSGLIEYLTDVMKDREALREHATALERCRPDQLQHIANLEAERPHLLGHIENLEAELVQIRSRGVLTQVGRAGKQAASKFLTALRGAVPTGPQAGGHGDAT